MFLLNSVKSLVLIQSGNAFHCLAEKELNALNVQGTQDFMVRNPIIVIIKLKFKTKTISICDLKEQQICGMKKTVTVQHLNCP